VIRSFLSLISALVTGAGLLPFVIAVCTWLLGGGGARLDFWAPVLIGAGVVGIFCLWLSRVIRRAETWLARAAELQAGTFERIPERWASTAIAVSAGVSLFLELAIIRWHSSEWEIFALYKNFSLLACFLGLGLGYALARRDRIPLTLVLPLLAFQFAYLVALRHGAPANLLFSLRATPITEQLNMGFAVAHRTPQYVAVYALIGWVLLATALAFIPVGQTCGRLLERLSPLRGYGWNLVGSLGGVALMFLVSYLWTPPVVWFAIPVAALVWLQAHDRGAARVGVAAGALIVIGLTWPSTPGWERIYSPYQLLERGPGEHGLSLIRAAGHYYQRVHDLSTAAQAAFPERRSIASYYELPYRFKPGARRVAIVGAGTGNDVAAALRASCRHVDAIEIDPAILRLGLDYHPEHPYADPRVTAVVNDARTFLRRLGPEYDLVVYGLLDSHTLLSHSSSVRLDSYVYTVEAFREARRRLTPDGVLSLSFAVLSDELGRKLYLMLTQAFDGHPPIAIFSRYDAAVTFVQSREGDLRWDPAALAAIGFDDRTQRYADPSLKADLSTDDWPFFYMPRRVYPVSYVWGVLLVLALALLLHRAFVGVRASGATIPFFFLGAGFMLVETKGIAELGLAFGNTWQVIGIVIGAILIMAWLGNWIADRWRIARPLVPWLLLLASLGLSLAFVRIGGIGSAAPARWLAVVLLTCPLFFSGIVFSTIFASAAQPAAALGLNLLGAMLGGVLEYNAMYFGFQALYWFAAALYAAGLGVYLLQAGGQAAPAR
jgi:spermidine synthase